MLAISANAAKNAQNPGFLKTVFFLCDKTFHAALRHHEKQHIKIPRKSRMPFSRKWTLKIFSGGPNTVEKTTVDCFKHTRTTYIHALHNSVLGPLGPRTTLFT